MNTKNILAKYPTARKNAVENFLMSVGNNKSKMEALVNLNADKGLYKWNDATVSAIKEGIEEYFSKEAQPATAI